MSQDCRSPGRRLNDNTIKWSPPPEDHIKINFDGSVIQSSGNAADGFILRDHAGCPIAAASKRIGKTSVPVAEATALRDGLLKAKELGYQKILAEGDSKLI